MTAQTMLRLRPYQQECLDALEASWKEVQRPAAVLATGLGKGHPVDTEIVTPDGLRKWGDLVPGDLVYGSAGQPTEVTAVYDRGALPSYRVTFSDGASVITDGDHLWAVQDRAHRNTRRAHRVLSTDEIRTQGLRHGRSYRWAVPVAPSVSPDVLGLPVGPYTLGALIANGYLSGTSPVVTTPDEEVMDRVRTEHEVTRHAVDESKYCPRYTVRGIAGAVRRLGLAVHSRDKFIPRIYLDAGSDQRLALLHGLMDGDGSSRTGGRRSAVYHTTSPRLAEDVQELVCSLGGTARIRSYGRVRPGSGEPYQDVRVSVLLPSVLHPFSTRRRDREGGPRRVFEPRRTITGIERVADREIRCIRVAAEDSLYQVTRQRIVTHNTVIFSHLAQRHRERRASRVVILVHRDELADQTLDKLRTVAPHMRTGKVKAGDNDVTADVLVCSVQTLAREARIGQLLAAVPYAGHIGLVIVDECHHALAVSYRNVMAALGCYSGEKTRVPGEYDVRAAGFTATLARGDGNGLGDVWQEVPFVRSVLWGVRHGFLTDVRAHQIDLDGLDLNQVKRSGGDYTAKSLGEALMDADAPRAVRQVLEQYAPDRRSIIVFTPTVAVAAAVTEHLNGEGIPAGYVHGGTPRPDRLRLYERFRRGEVRVLVNCMVLTEGADFPFADCAVIARPTRSDTLFIQMAGRVLRPSPQTGKSDALLLLLAGGGASIRTLVDLDPAVIVPVADGESLGEAHERQEKIREELEEKRNQREAARARPLRLTSKALDLFASSPAYQWLRTAKGVQFIPLGSNGEVFLWPSQQKDLWDVVWAPSQPKVPWERLHTGLELAPAMAWGESEAEERSDLNTSRSASWRKRPASESQIRYARQFTRDVREGMRAGEVGDIISTGLASRKIDRYVPRS